MLQRSNMVVLLLALIIYAYPALSQLENNEFGEVKPTPVLKPNLQDVATVLVADINNRGAHGRFINIKPEIGLLKSTARTFIQDGIKTEYVTKVIGTTIDNGQYVQLLTTTSRVLYNSDSNQQTKTVNLNAIDGNDEASFLNSPPSSPFLQNVDYIVPNNPYLVFPARRNNNENLINYKNNNINDNENEESELTIKAEKLVEAPKKLDSVPQPAKVIPEGNLPTYTVSHDGPIFEAQAPKTNSAPRVGKVITYEDELKEAAQAPKILPSVTYFGFADFTTTVGDTVIIFSPSTAKPQIDKDHITSIKGEPTLNIKPTTTKQQHITFESVDEPRFTPKIVETAMPTIETISEATTSAEKEISKHETTTSGSEETLSTTTESEEEDTSIEDTESPPTTTKPKDNAIIRIIGTTTPESIESSQVSSNVDSVSSQTTQKFSSETTQKYASITTAKLSTIGGQISSSVIGQKSSVNAQKSSSITNEKSSINSQKSSTIGSQKSSSVNAQKSSSINAQKSSFINTQKSSSVTTPKYSKPSEEDVQRILASLASAQKVESTSITPSNAETKVVTGSSIIFFDYDEEVDVTTPKSSFKAIESTRIVTATPETTTTESSSEEDEDEAETTEKPKPLTPRPVDGCSSTMLKTLTYLTTFYVPIDEIITTTSVETSQTVQSTVVPVDCPIEPTSVAFSETTRATTKYLLDKEQGTVKYGQDKVQGITKNVQEKDETMYNVDKNQEKDKSFIKEKDQETEGPTYRPTTQKPETTTLEIVTESSTIEEETTVEPVEDEEDIEIIYKTLYTTYTYLTTFFQESSSTVSSRKEIVTNVITSTINANDFASLLNQFEPSATDEAEIKPTQVDHGIGRPTEKFILPESDFIGVNQLLDNEKVEYTPALGDDDIGNEIKTLYTTYTYFTTVFDNDKTDIVTRTEVYTNIINPSSSLANVLQRDVLESKFVDVEKEDNNSLSDGSKKEGKKLKIDENDIKYSTMIRNSTELLASSSDDSASPWDDVKSSTSEGERSFIENIDRRHYSLDLEDQISSESNTEEGIPSPTLLLQTRYTTFTYYTTVYTAGTASNVLSRLETLTNVVTETLSPTQVQKLDDATVPITYFTTFTYWTTFYKDGKTETTSREETVSNVITPSALADSVSQVVSISNSNTNSATAIMAKAIDSTEVIGEVGAEKTGKAIDATEVVDQVQSSTKTAEIKPSVTTLLADLATLLVQPLAKPADTETQPDTAKPSIEASQSPSDPLEPTTVYTTYTYYTTNYVGDATVIDSRFETETNIITPSIDFKTGARAIDVSNPKVNDLAVDNKPKKIDGIKIEATPVVEIPSNLMPTGIVSINHGKIIDAEGISTTHFETKAIGTYNGELYAEVIESSTSIEIDEIRKAIQPTEVEGSTRHHKTGLVRLVDGTIVNKNMTTLYESKVIGTFIEGRYAQVIESTSSIILAKVEPSAVDNRVNIDATAAHVGGVTPSSNVINPTPAVLEGSISESANQEEHTEHPEEGDEEDEEDQDEKQKGRLPFQSRKKSFTPVIRPFASRPRPTFNPKRKNATNGPAIITPTEITPTIKATAVKSLETSRNRFAGGRRSSSAGSVSFGPSSSIASSAAGPASSRRPSFSRPSSSRASFQPTSSIRPSKSSASSSRVQPTSLLPGGSIRRPLLRSSLPVSRASSLNSIAPSLPAIGRNRNIRPSVSASKEVTVQASITTPEPDEFETTLVTDEPSDEIESESQEPITTTTENSRRNNNPLLRVRRPPLGGGRPNPPVVTQRSATITTRRNPLARTSRVTTQATTTTTTERTTRNRPLFRPTFAPVQIGGTRSRPSNLFPPRRTTTQAPQAIDEEEEEEGNHSEEEYDYDETKIKEVQASPARPRGGRVKRQAFDYGTRSPNYNPRFKKPTTSRNSRADYYTYDSEELIVTEAPRTRAATSRYSGQRSRTSSNNHEVDSAKSRIKPTTSSSQSNNRLLFTLRKEDTSPAVTSRSSFRRPQPASSFNANNRRTTATTRNVNKFGRYHQDSSRSNSNSQSSRGRTSSRRGTTSRSRVREDTFNYVAPKFDGTITVTHHIPTEVTIPVVVGKNTEYKSVITAKPSTEILGPKQYSTSLGSNGQTTLVILEEKTVVNPSGQTEITQYVLSETPTTSITFTPTTIRGRKTSFSHVIPSTVYDAHPVVSTIQPQILPGSGSLANILLSQLLLSPQNQQLGFNPLLGYNPQIPQVLPQIQATPVTEFKTRTTTYVTTIHEGKSTVLPITFRGMKIYTTVFDDASQVITATEFITDTLVITPTQALLPQVAQTANLNSLLLPLLLQQQQQQQQQQNLNLQNINTQPASFVDILKPQLENIADDKNIQSITPDETQNNSKEEDYEEVVESKPNKLSLFKAHAKPEKKLETSVVTLYISGRVPGDFSTVLSTIVSENPVYKRSAAYVDVKASALPNLDVLEAEASDNHYEYVLSGSSNDIEPEPREEASKETESLDVVFGDYNKYTSSVLM